MKICEEICHGLKHCELTSPRIFDPNFNIFKEYDPFAEALVENPVSITVTSEVKGTKELYEKDLFKLIGDCYKHWEIFITERKLDKHE